MPDMAGSIRFHTEDCSFQLKQKRKIRLWLSKVIHKNKLKYTDLNFIFCSDEYLLEINKYYLHHDFYTDIITFQNNSGNSNLCGDLFISIPRVKENARKYKVEFTLELHRVMVHGILHLMGFKDKKKADALIMRKMENKMLSLRTF